MKSIFIDLYFKEEKTDYSTRFCKIPWLGSYQDLDFLQDFKKTE